MSSPRAAKVISLNEPLNPMPTQLSKTALITGITGQDGSYLAELLLRKGLQSTWDQAARFLVQHQPDRSPLPGPARDG